MTKRIKKIKQGDLPLLLIKHGKMIPQKIRWQRKGKKFSKAIISTSQLPKIDKEGKEHELILTEGHRLKPIRRDADSYPERFTQLEFKKALCRRIKPQDWEIITYKFEEFKETKEIAKLTGLTPRRINQILKWKKLLSDPIFIFNPIITRELVEMLGVNKFVKLYGELISTLHPKSKPRRN